MRSLVVLLILIFGWLYTLKRAYIGVLVWSWISYMNPHRLSFGFAYDMPLAQITAIVTIFAFLYSKETQKIPINKITVIWIMFVGFMGITTLNAYFPDDAYLQYTKVIKIQLVTFITLKLITDFTKLNQLIWVIALSIGFFSVKGGIFTILTGGGSRVWGPPGTFIEDNNELAIAVLMTIPLMAYLYRISKRLWVKYGLMVAMPLSFISAIGSQSRGALVAFGAVVLFFWLKSKQKALSGLIMVILSFGIYTQMPASWHERMNTIKSYEEDTSAMGRINAWEYAYNVANNRLLGAGFDSWKPETFALYAPNPTDVHAAHSIYFSVLGDHGWIGLVLFLLIYFLSWRKLTETEKKTRKIEELKDINQLATMMQVSFIAYLVGGAFLSLAYFDLPWHLISITVLISTFLEKRIIELSNTEQTSPTTPKPNQ